MAKSKRRSRNYSERLSYDYQIKDTKINELEDKPHTGKIQTTSFISPRTYHQRRFVNSIKDNFITLGIGYAGTGKTLLALHTAICLVNSDNNPLTSVIYVRANVEVDFEQSMGALPGELQDKTLFMADPVLDNLTEFMTIQTARYALQKEKIVVRPVNLLRGRSFKNSVVIIEEAQNIPAKYIKMLLTRAGENSKVILIGDTDQIDLKRHDSGLQDCMNRLYPLKEKGLLPMDIILFNDLEDIQRNSLLGLIIQAYS